MRSLLWTAALLLAGGCTADGGDDGGDDCPPYAEPAAGLGYRDPQTAVCEGLGRGGGCWGDDLSLGGASTDLAFPDWATCPGSCEALDERSCIRTAGCRATYSTVECPATGNCTAPFLECWGVAPTGPIQGECLYLDAQACSRHDDCMTMYLETDAGGLRFFYCAPERVPRGCELANCPPDWSCEETCYRIDCPDPAGDCEPWCEGACVPESPEAGPPAASPSRSDILRGLVGW